MARQPKSPQEKKRLSLQRDRRNTYGENDKSSRKNIPRSKANAHRVVRRTGKQSLDAAVREVEERAEVFTSTLSTPRLQKGDWKKSPDRPLGEVIQRQKRRTDRDTP